MSDSSGAEAVDIPESVEDAPVVKLPDDAEENDLQAGVSYLAHVGGVKNYGIFVDMTPRTQHDLGGLVHQDDMGLFARSHEFSEGDPVIVTPVQRRSYDEFAFCLVDTLWNKAVTDVDITRTYAVDGYPSLDIGEDIRDQSSSEGSTLGDQVDGIENLDNVGQKVMMEASEEEPEPGKEPEADTKLSLVLRAIEWVGEPATSTELNERLDTTNTSRQLLDLMERNYVERHDNEDDDDESRYEYTLTEFGEEAAESLAEQEERSADDYPSEPDEPSAAPAQEPQEDATEDTDMDAKPDTHEPDEEQMTEMTEEDPDAHAAAEQQRERIPSPAEQSLRQAIDLAEDALEAGYEVGSVSTDMEDGAIDINVRLEDDDD